MKLHPREPGWAERLVTAATPSITLYSAVPPHLTGLARMREETKIRLRALLHARLTPEWLRLLNSHPAFSEYVRHSPRFLYKVFRPYCSLALTPAQRLEAIRAHYLFMFRRGLGQTIARAALGPVVLAQAAGESGALYRIQLRTMDLCDREGELALQLTLGDKVLGTTAFTIAPRDGMPAVSIGGMQRAGTADAREAAGTATRDLHGLPPNQLLAGVARHLGHAYGCERLLMVSDRNRVVAKALRRGRVPADYDRLWVELGARRRPDGDYDLPCSPVRAPDLDAVPLRKRWEARQRHELLLQLAEGVAAALRAPNLAAELPVPATEA